MQLEFDGVCHDVSCLMVAAIQEGFKIRERIDEFDEATHTIGYTVLEGDPGYKSLKATLKYTYFNINLLAHVVDHRGFCSPLQQFSPSDSTRFK